MKNYRENTDAYKNGYDYGFSGTHDHVGKENPYPTAPDRAEWYRGRRDGAWDNGERAY
jgi:ribosome modulation factor